MVDESYMMSFEKKLDDIARLLASILDILQSIDANTRN